MKSRKRRSTILMRRNARLEERVLRRTLELQNALNEVLEAKHQLLLAHKDTIHRLAVASEFKDQDTADHLQRMSRYVRVIAEGLGLPEREVEVLCDASPMHDVGKIGIPETILFKPGPLDAPEWEVMKRHSSIGARILAGSPSVLLQAGEVIARTHHEKWDGSGYPAGLSGDRIPLWGRICTVADVFDALTSKRPYKEAFSNERAFSLLEAGMGRHFDPVLVDVFLEQHERIRSIQRDFQQKSGTVEAPL